MKSINYKNKSGFTLIELLVVIAIIGILATIVTISTTTVRARARDVKRVADIKQTQTALEVFYNDNNRYPTEAEWNSGTLVSSTAIGTTTYMAHVPVAANPPDGACVNDNQFFYTQLNSGSSYNISYCIGGAVASINSGINCASPEGITAGALCAPDPNPNCSPNDSVNSWQTDSDGYRLIHTCCELQHITDDPNQNYALANNLNCSNTSNSSIWTSGYGFAPIQNFTGNFNGHNFRIDGVYMHNPTVPNNQYVGIFGSADSSNFSNVRLSNLNIILDSGSWNQIGGLVGSEINNAGNSLSFSNISSQGTITINSGNSDSISMVGGIFGALSLATSTSPTTTINNLSSALAYNINGNGYVSSLGGLSGYINANSINISNCSAAGDINNLSGNLSSVGGLIGGVQSDNSLVISNSIYKGNLSIIFSGGGVIGGLIGGGGVSGGDNSSPSFKVINSRVVGNIYLKPSVDGASFGIVSGLLANPNVACGGESVNCVSKLEIDNSSYAGNISMNDSLNGAVLYDYGGLIGMGGTYNGDLVISSSSFSGDIILTSASSNNKYNSYFSAVGGLVGSLSLSANSGSASHLLINYSNHFGDLSLNSTGNAYGVGGLIGMFNAYSQNNSIVDIKFLGSMSVGDISVTSNDSSVNYVGGVIGKTAGFSDTNLNCFQNIDGLISKGDITINTYGNDSYDNGCSAIGGLIGDSDQQFCGLTIASSSALGNITLSNTAGGNHGSIGGLFGHLSSDGVNKISQSFYSGMISVGLVADGHSNNSIGGFVGMMNGQENDISFSYANAILNYSSSLSDFGCFTGLIIGDPNNITASYYNYEICNLSDNYATPKTTNDLQTLSTYINDGWQICGYNGGDIWHLQSGNLPCLSNAVGCGACQ